MKKAICLAILVFLATTGLPSAAQSRATAKNRPAQPSPGDGGSEVKPATTDPGYILGAEDVIIINVWKEPELSMGLQVRPDGKISLPLLNDLQAAGMTPVQLGMSITEKLKKFVANPQVTVIVQAINSRRIHMVGEVGRAGTIPLLPDMTVLQALAGGFTQFANTKKIYILRTENGVQTKYPFNYKEVINGKRPEQNILLKPGDTIVVP